MTTKGYVIIASLLFAMQLSAQECKKKQLISLFNEAEQYYLIDDYEQLMSCIKQYADIFEVCRDCLGDSVDVYQAYYSKMCGAFYYGIAEKGNYDDDAETMYRKSLDIFSKRNDATHAVVIQEELAQLYYKTKNYEQARALLDSVYNYHQERFVEMGVESFEPKFYKTMSQLAMCNARLLHFDMALSQIDEAINSFFKKHKNAEYYEALRKRGKILMLQADFLGRTNNDKAVDCYRRYVNERYADIDKEMSSLNLSQRNQYWLATHQFLYDCYRLGNRAPEMLYDLALFSKDYLVRRNAKRTKWTQVKQALRKNECAIEFVQYFGRNDEKRMGCLAVKGNSQKPLFIDLFSTDSLLSLPLTELHTIGSAITSTSPYVKDTLYNAPLLPEMIWTKKLMVTIGNADKVYFSPDGLLHQIAIEYLMPDTTKVCIRLSSTRLLAEKRRTPKMRSALLCGGIDYGAVYQPTTRDNDVVAYRYLASETSEIDNLRWARIEVDSIYAARNNHNDFILIGEDATDEAFLRFSELPFDIIHISTHGYFGGRIGIYNDIKPLLGDESMSKSGLLFAGAAKTLADDNFDENLFDGVLSAAELSKMNLSSTELIVLSACQTGLGHLTDDGVYGIQRGLKQAGAQTMILSLWSVNDYSCSLLMCYFYNELEKQSTKDIHAAFLQARKRLMQEEKTIYMFDPADFTIKEEKIKYDEPRHVDPFIIIDAI